MILEKGNIWSVWGKTDLFLFTANSTVKRNDRLVMGRGLAKECRDSFPGIDLLIGKNILDKTCYKYTYGYFGLICVEYNDQMIGAFQVKYHYDDPATTELIARSSLELFNLINTWFHNRHGRVDINFPGIGNGRLNRDEVFNIIRFLPDCVHVWEYE